MPLPVNPDRVPPLTAISPDVKFVDASDSVKVRVATWPTPKDAMSLTIAIVGTVVSGTTVFTVILTVLSVSTPSVFTLPAASVNAELATLMTAGVVLPAVGVKMAL